ncbi:MAG: CPBP family intramembrane glutamic endopeptidase [Chloroflexota bacterium]
MPQSHTYDNVDPVPLWQALLIFGIPGIMIYLGVHYLVPIMVESGIPLVFAWTLAVVGPTVLNAIIILAYYCSTQKPTFQQFVRRFRLNAPSKNIIWQVPTMVVVIVILNELLSWTVPYLSQIPILTPPTIIPEIFTNVYESLDGGSNTNTFMGEDLTPDKWWLVPFWLFCWVTLAVIGEEIVWRGYVLPGQEVIYGNYAWLINGLLWNIPFHLYTMHNFFSDMPLYLLLPLVVYRTRNSWVGIGIHALLVSIALVILIPGLL